MVDNSCTDYTLGLPTRVPLGSNFTAPREPQRNWSAAPMEPHVGDVVDGRRVFPLLWQVFDRLLEDHPNQGMRRWVVHGVKEGFDNYADFPEEGELHEPLTSAFEYKEAVSEWLAEEAAAGRFGECTEKPHPHLHASPVGRAPKKGGKSRIIHHLSKAKILASINGTIDPEDFSCEYVRVQTAVAAMSIYHEVCGGAVWSAADVKHGFRNLPLHPSVYHLHALLWNGSFWVDRATGFGGRFTPFSFTAVSEAAAWVIQRRPKKEFGEITVEHKGEFYKMPLATVCVLMDDFIVISPLAQGKRAEGIMHEVLQELGLPRQLSKDKPVSPEGKYLGWWLDSQLQKMRLPDDKRDAITAHINRMLIPKERKDGSVQPISEMGFFLKNDLESLIGKLTHGNLVFPESRPFVNSLLGANRKLNKAFKRGKPDKAMARSARVFLAVLPRTRSFADILRTHDGGVEGDWACGDASGDGGLGYFSETRTCTHHWGKTMAAGIQRDNVRDLKVSSTLQETACMVVAFLEWSRSANAGSWFTYLTDADNLAHNWKRGRSATDRINSLLLLVSQTSLDRDLHLRVVWHSRRVPDARLADMLSRGDVQGFRASSPLPIRNHGPIPACILSEVRASLRMPTPF